MKTISLCMIVKNEENNIKNCLDSVHDLVEEIIIVDTGSTDRTKEICSTYPNVKLYDFEWIYDFSAARNYSKSKATMEYIWWLDADDTLKEEDREKFKTFKANMDGSINNFSMICDYRHNQKGECTFSFAQTRIVKNTENVYWECVVHELLHHDEGYELDLDIHITHTTNDDHNDRSVLFFEKSMELGHTLNTREKYYYGGELFVQGREEEAINILEEFISDINYPNRYERARAYNYLAKAYYNKQDYYNASLNYLGQIGSSEVDMETFYNIADCYEKMNKVNEAIFYYECVTTIPFKKEKFMNGSEYDITNKEKFMNQMKFKAHMNLVVLYYNIKDMEKSIYHNTKAGELFPNNSSFIYNKEFFERKLKILLVGPNAGIPIPPAKYGGVEQVMYNLAEDLIKLGHSVTMLAPVGSHSSAEIIFYDQGVPPEKYIMDHLDLLEGYDVIHDHSAFVAEELLKNKPELKNKIVFTNHYVTKYNMSNIVFVSKASQERIGTENDTYVYNGINLDDYIYSENKEDFLLFLGRIDNEKRPDLAISLARKAKRRLIIAGPIHDQEYFDDNVKPYIDGINILYVGEVGGKFKAELLSKAECVLFSSFWNEPFGLVLVEAMASGTPVVAFDCGAAKEVLVDFPNMVGSFNKILNIIREKDYPSSKELLESVKKRFTREVMAKDYEKVYRNIVLKSSVK